MTGATLNCSAPLEWIAYVPGHPDGWTLIGPYPNAAHAERNARFWRPRVVAPVPQGTCGRLPTRVHDRASVLVAVGALPASLPGAPA